MKKFFIVLAWIGMIIVSVRLLGKEAVYVWFGYTLFILYLSDHKNWGESEKGTTTKYAFTLFFIMIIIHFLRSVLL